MRISHSTILTPFTLLGCILSILHLASTAPIPSSQRLSPQSLARMGFPYPISGSAPLPTMLHKAGSVLDSCTQPNAYAISFDDGPGSISDELLDYLDEQNLKVTFFMNGDNWNCIYRPESQRLLKRAYQAQHQIATHPWSHQDLESLSDHDIRQEMYKMEDAFRQILGVVPRYMRPPFGEHSERVRKVLEEMGYVLVLWDVDQLASLSVSSSSSSSSRVEPTTTTMEEHEHLPMVSNHAHYEHRHVSQMTFSSKWAEAVRGVGPSRSTLDRESMVMGGIYHEEATSIWAVEYVQGLEFEITRVGECLGEVDPRLWYKEIGEAAKVEDVPQSCFF